MKLNKKNLIIVKKCCERVEDGRRPSTTPRRQSQVPFLFEKSAPFMLGPSNDFFAPASLLTCLLDNHFLFKLHLSLLHQRFPFPILYSIEFLFKIGGFHNPPPPCGCKKRKAFKSPCRKIGALVPPMKKRNYGTEIACIATTSVGKVVTKRKIEGHP